MAGTYEIAAAGEEDAADLTTVLLACERHYWGSRDGDEGLAAGTARALLAGDSGCRVLLARRAGQASRAPLGFATYALLHPGLTEAGTIYLKDLFVAEAARGSGLGEELLAAVARIAVEKGCKRLDWTTESNNPKAMAFYERLGAARVEDKVYYRLAGTDLELFVETRS